MWRIAPNHTETRTVDMHIANLRQKLRDDAAAPALIVTVRGKGYRYEGGQPAPQDATAKA